MTQQCFPGFFQKTRPSLEKGLLLSYQRGVPVLLTLRGRCIEQCGHTIVNQPSENQRKVHIFLLIPFQVSTITSDLVT